MVGAPQALKNLRIFERICGRHAFKNVIFTTTMWGDVDEETGLTREAELKDDYWKSMINLGASIGRFEGSRDSAFRLISPFLDEANSRIALSIQKELVDLGFRLSDTAASQVLRLEIERLQKRQQEELHQVRKELRRPNNASSLQLLMEDYKALKKVSGSLFGQMDDLHVPLSRRVTNTVARTLGIKRNRCVYKILIIGPHW